MAEGEDLRIVKTRKNIKRTFVRLLKNQSFESITVQQLTAEALISKATFYHHYRDKFDLAEQVIEEFLKEYKNVAARRFENIKEKKYPLLTLEEIRSDHSALVSKIKLFRKVHIDGLDVEAEMQNILENLYREYVHRIGKNVSNIDYQSYLFALLILKNAEYSDTHNVQISTLNMAEDLAQLIEIIKTPLGDLI